MRCEAFLLLNSSTFPQCDLSPSGALLSVWLDNQTCIVHLDILLLCWWTLMFFVYRWVCVSVCASQSETDWADWERCGEEGNSAGCSEGSVWSIWILACAGQPWSCLSCAGRWDGRAMNGNVICFWRSGPKIILKASLFQWKCTSLLVSFPSVFKLVLTQLLIVPLSVKCSVKWPLHSW